MATSASAGYIPPSVSPLYDDALDRIFHDVIYGITAVDKKLIRPRWQPEPPNQPDFTVNWVAFGVSTSKADVFSSQVHDPTIGSNGADTEEYDENLRVLLSFYGPGGSALQARWNAGLQIAQNRYQLDAAGIKLVEVQERIMLPALFKEKWTKRVDSAAVFRRRVSWQFAIETLESASGDLDNDLYSTSIIVNP